MKSIKVKIQNHILIYRFLFGKAKEKLRLFFAISANILYITWNSIFAFIYKDSLLLAVSVYYILLAIMRYALLKEEKENKAVKNAPLAVGLLLIPTVLAMAGVMISTLVRGTRKKYSPLSIIPQSLFLLFCLIAAIIRIARHKSHHGALALCTNVISLAAAFFSVFNLANYLSNIGTPHFDGSLTLLIGLIAVITVLASSLMLIVKSKKH